MSLNPTELQALQRFALGQALGEQFSYDARRDILTLRPTHWGARLVRLLWTLITFGRRDGFADMRWPLIAKKIHDKAESLFAVIESDTQRTRIRIGLRAKLMAANASFRARHPNWQRDQRLAPLIHELDRWLGRSIHWRDRQPPTRS